MKNWKVHILEELRNGPMGGGNQFLKALRGYFRELGQYAEESLSADLILINSFPFGNLRMLPVLARLRALGKPIVHRLDGPISVVRGRDRAIDWMIQLLNAHFSDASLFQTEWSRQKCYELGLAPKELETVVINGCDESIFFPAQSGPAGDKIKIVATSWSPNWKKGFDVYQHLDSHLDFSRYEMVFVGNSPIAFRNIRAHAPVGSRELAEILRQNHLYITASVDDPCSNSLIEALACGLSTVVRRSGGHPEIAGINGELFSGQEDVLAAIENAAKKDLSSAWTEAPNYSIHRAGEKYKEFFDKVFRSHEKKPASPGLLGIRRRQIESAYAIWYASTYARQAVFKRLKTLSGKDSP